MSDDDDAVCSYIMTFFIKKLAVLIFVSFFSSPPCCLVILNSKDAKSCKFQVTRLTKSLQSILIHDFCLMSFILTGKRPNNGGVVD